MNVYEMEGFLRGKCLPGDLLVGESHVEYLVRKLNEATAAKDQRDALLAENAALKAAMHPESIPDDVLDVFTDTVTYDYESCDACSWAWVKNTDEVIKAVMNAMPRPETPSTTAAVAAIEARFCGLLETYETVEPERFNPEFADLYAKIVNRIFSSAMDNPSVTDLESLTDYLDSSAENARAYADMSMKFHAELREAK